MFAKAAPLTTRTVLLTVGVGAAALILAVPHALGATTDTATAAASPAPYLVGQPITFTSTTPCTVACRLIWRYLDGSRLGVQLGEGDSVERAFDTPGVKTVQLELSEACVGTSLITCTSLAYVSLTVEDAPPPPPADTTPPTFAVSGLSAEATGAATAVGYTFNATDPDDAVVSQSCAPAPGSSFPVGSTTVACTATDTHGNVGAQSFAVVVSDRTAPTVSVPDAVTRNASSAAGASVTFAASANDLVDGQLVPVCSPPSGSNFAVGSTTVTCTATDAHGNVGSRSFSVTVAAAAPPTGSTTTTTTTVSTTTSTDPAATTTVTTTAPTVSDTTPPTVLVPGALTRDATSAAGAAVAFAVSASDLRDGPLVPTCSRASGSVFPIGSTTVNCTATDSQGNTSAASRFTVHVAGAAEQLTDVLLRVQTWGVRAKTLQQQLRRSRSAAGAGAAAGACRPLRALAKHPALRTLASDRRAWLRRELARIVTVLDCNG